jgi:hypothetical protein
MSGKVYNYRFLCEVVVLFLVSLTVEVASEDFSVFSVLPCLTDLSLCAEVPEGVPWRIADSLLCVAVFTMVCTCDLGIVLAGARSDVTC